MKRFLLSVLLCFIVTIARSATGDVTVTVNPDGYSASVFTAGFTTGASYAFGFGTNNVPSATTPYFTVVSLGYDNTGAATTRTRRVYMTKVMRFPYNTSYVTGTHGTGTFVDGELVTQAVSSATGIIVGDQATGTRLYFKCITGTFNNTGLITGGTSSATFTSTSTITTPAQLTPNEQVNSTAMVVQVALSDYIFQKDNTGGGNSGTAPTVTIPAAFITNSGGASQTSNVLTAAAVTQSSTAVYPKVVSNWSWPGYQRVTGDFPLRCVAFHGTSVHDGTNQISPGTMNIACVKFTAADTHSHTATTTVTAPTYDSTVGDAAPVVEFVGTMSVTTLTALDVLTCNYIAYPLVGDSGAILDTSAGTSQPTPLYGPITQINDKSNTYGRTFAAADSAGSDANPAIDRGAYASDALADAAALAAPCKTIGGAYAAIVAYNLANHSRNDGGGGEIILKNQNYSWVGAGSSFGVKPGSWPTIRPATGYTAAQCVLNDQAGGSNLNHVVKLSNVTIGNNGGSYPYFYPCDSLWFDQCIMSSTGAAVLNDDCKAFSVTRCTMAGFAQGLRMFGAANTAPRLIRGNNFDGFVKGMQCYTVIGNAKNTKDVSGVELLVQDFTTGQAQPPAVNSILAFNVWKGFDGGNRMLNYTGVFANTHGAAIVQNVFEVCDGSITSLGDIVASGSVTPNNNYIVWNNTNIGQRILRAFDFTTTTTPWYRKYWSEKNNSLQIYAMVADLPQDDAGNGARIGAWTSLFGVASSGNFISVPPWSSTGGMPESVGLSGRAPARGAGGAGTDASNWAAYIDYEAWLGAGSTPGLGNYGLLGSSPVIGYQRELLVPYDLAGVTRTASAAAGAYQYAGSGRQPLYFIQRSKVSVPGNTNL